MKEDPEVQIVTEEDLEARGASKGDPEAWIPTDKEGLDANRRILH